MRELALDQEIKSYLWQKIIRRPLYEGIMFPVSVKCMEDYARLHEIVLKAEKIYYISRPLYFYRMRGDSLTAKTDLEIEFNNYLIAKGRNTFLKEHGFTPPRMDTYSLCSEFLRNITSAARRSVPRLKSAMKRAEPISSAMSRRCCGIRTALCD